MTENISIPHILVESKKELHGWWNGYCPSGRRECSQERMLVNPYAGCSVGCAMCYSRALPGYFRQWNQKGVITVFKDFDKEIGKQLDRLYVASCAYLSPVTDPFQRPLENMYHLSERCAYAFLDRGLPVEFITKQGSNVPDALLERMAGQPHSFAQFTVFTAHEEFRQFMSPNGDSIDQQFSAVERTSKRGIFTVVRIDPWFPYIDDLNNIETLVKRAEKAGAKHIIFSYVDIPLSIKHQILEQLDLYHASGKPKSYRGRAQLSRLYQILYTDLQGRDLNAHIEFRREVFAAAKEICTKHSLTFALCMEFECRGDRYFGLNEDYMTSPACEGLKVPVYRRDSLDEKFSPIEGCDGNCLAFAKSKGSCNLACGTPTLAEAGALRLSNYLKMSKIIKNTPISESKKEGMP